MANFDSQWAFGAFDAPTTMTATTYTLPHLSDPTSTVFSGTGFTYSGDVPTGGTITSISLVVNDGGGVLATITNINISLADFGDLLTDIYAMRALIPWEGVLSEDAEGTVSPTLIRLENTDGTFTDIVGSGFDVTAPGSYIGTVTNIRHIASDETTVLDDVATNTSLQLALSALYEEFASDALWVLINTGANTMTFNGAITVGADTYSVAIEDGPGDDSIVANYTNAFMEFEYATSGVTVDIGAGTATGGGGSNTLNSNITGAAGSNFNDTMTGDSQSNSFDGNDANDTLNGGDGDDMLEGGFGDDVLNGGAGIDTATYDDDDVEGGVTVSLAIAGAQNTGEADIDTLIDIENLTGTGYADTLTGDGGANVLSGGGGNDTLNGGGANDTLNGGDGNDVLRGGFGNDAMVGGLGDDYYYAEHAGDVITELAGQGTDTVETALANYTMVAHTENLILSGSADINATGTTAANVMTGNSGSNTLIGGLGNDVLQGLGGKDLLTGGGGLDTFVFTSLSDSAVAFAGREAINTFAHGDKIDLSAIDANTTIAGNQAFTWTPGGFTGVAGQLYVQQNAARSWTVWADVNGDAVADFALNIYGAPSLNNGIFAWDFIL